MSIPQILAMIQSLLGTISVVQGVVAEAVALLKDLQESGRALTPEELQWLHSIRVDSEVQLQEAIDAA